jgi:transposase InsO family protein
MPWKNELPMEQKQRFISLAQSGHFTVTELCGEFGIARKTGHKWLGRYAAGGIEGLVERSRAPRSVTGRTPRDVEWLIVSEKRLHLTWGPKKIQRVLIVKHGLENPPVVSTVGEVLKRHGMVEARKRRGAVFKVERGTLTAPERCNHVFGVDFKGWFLTGDGERCDPLTVSDLHSRYLLRAEGLPQATTRWTQGAFRGLFRQQGIPEIIRVDNGAPFASMGPGGLSKLSVWWIGLGIEVQFSRPACPQDNGCHERMHRTMKAECCKPPSANLRAQQQRFDRWRKEFNEERPHEALGMRMPANVYHASARRLDERIKPRLYDLGTQTRSVSAAGYVALNGGNSYVGESFAGVDVALERDEKSGLLLVRYANVRLGNFDDAPNARLRPTAYAERWERKPCAADSIEVSTKV